MTSVYHKVPIDQRNALIRSAFVAQGTSLHAWCLSVGINPHNARKAIIGKWTGPKAEQLVQRAMIAAGVGQ